MLYLLDAVGSPALRLLFDTGNGVAHGYDSYELLERIVDNVEHVHVKDGERRGDAVAYLPPGEGTARVGDCLRLLLARGYRGCWSIEPHIAFRPEEGDGPPEGQRRQAFAASGLALQRLVREQVIPACPGWTADGAQLERRRCA
jgi:sugar phosphate isomerase/epimerase